MRAHLRRVIVACAVTWAGATVACHASPRAEMGDDGRSVLYDGQVVRLLRPYQSYEDYKADPNNIDPTENAHVERLMIGAAIPRRFSSRADAFAAVVGLQFPGYGWWSLQAELLPGRYEWAVLAFEIPRSGKDRYVAIAADAQGWAVIDDFVADDGLGLRFAARRAGSITYSDRQHRRALIHVDRGDPMI